MDEPALPLRVRFLVLMFVGCAALLLVCLLHRTERAGQPLKGLLASDWPACPALHIVALQTGTLTRPSIPTNPDVVLLLLLQARLCPPLRIELAPKEEESYDDLDEIVAR
jgi:hypothetical protein